MKEAFVALVVMFACTPVLCAQSGQAQTPAKQAPATAATTATPLSHDLSGVWMQYPDKRVDGVPIVTGIDESARPPLTPWGQARFDAAVPFIGPRAVAGKENNPSLRCEPEAVPKSLILPNPFEIVQTPGRVFMFSRSFICGVKSGPTEGRCRKIRILRTWATQWASGRATPSSWKRSALMTGRGSIRSAIHAVNRCTSLNDTAA